ncbi:hypothetical protein TNCV_4920281 [Trichonephila clavipes]|nr:hypothetical protein TNCV_4920281 [Trichonephila clavipes]
MSGDKSSKEKAGKGRKGYNTSFDDREKKILCFRDKRVSWASIRSYLSDAGVSVSPKTTRSRLTKRNSPDLDPIENSVAPFENFCPKEFSFLERGTTLNGGVDEWASRSAHVIGVVMPNVLQPGEFVQLRRHRGPNEGAAYAWMAV